MYVSVQVLKVKEPLELEVGEVDPYKNNQVDFIVPLKHEGTVIVKGQNNSHRPESE